MNHWGWAIEFSFKLRQGAIVKDVRTAFERQNDATIYIPALGTLKNDDILYFYEIPSNNLRTKTSRIQLLIFICETFYKLIPNSHAD